jgi:hypothetical protein
MNDETKTLDPQFESDLAAIAVHEAGHFEASIALGIPATMRIDLDDAGNLRGGWCFQDFEGPPFENSCIAWAGIIAENLCGRIYRHSAQLLFPLNEEHLIRWHSEASFFLNHAKGFSAEDRARIVGIVSVAGGTTLETFQHTFRILKKRVREIEQDAKLLAARTRIEVAAKLAVAREFEEANKTASKWAAQAHKLSTAARASILENFLSNFPADAPERTKFAPMLDCLKRGIEPTE